MPKQIPQNEFDKILEIISQYPDGISLGNILKILSISIPRRQLQDRLAKLVNRGELIAIGNARARIYRLPSFVTKQAVKEEKRKNVVPLSFIAQELEQNVRRPIYERTPISYNREFLDSYLPNISNYLPETVRQKLYFLGKTDGERPAGTYARQVYSRLLIDLSWNSSRLEGNTYSLLETDRLLKLSEIAEGKDLKEARMIINHKDAIDFLVESAEHIGINRFTILNLHSLLSYDLLDDPQACGRLRFIPVGISRTVYQPSAVPRLIVECFQQILDKAKVIADPFEQAFFLMVHLPYLQPFEDVNKRVSRLSANIPLILNNLSPLSFVDVPQETYVSGLLSVYELNRIELLREVFVWAYERSSLRYSATRKELGEPDPLRMRYRELIKEIEGNIVLHRMDKTQAIALIREFAKKSIPFEDQSRFIEIVEYDLMNLHEGNIARLRLTPIEYETWQKSWH